MTDDAPYTKREVDEWRNHIQDQMNAQNKQLDRIEKVVSKKAQSYEKTVEKLAEITSHNSGQILALWDTIKKDRKAIAFIDDVTSFGIVTKWIVYTVIGAGALYSALRVLTAGVIVKLIARLYV